MRRTQPIQRGLAIALLAGTPAVAMAHVSAWALWWFFGAHVAALVCALALAVYVPVPRYVRHVAYVAAVAMFVGPFFVPNWLPTGIVYLVLFRGLGLRETVFTMVVATLVPPTLVVALVLLAGRTLARKIDRS